MPVPLYVVNAFTKDIYGGNPAAILFVDDFPETAQEIASTLNQPMSMFIRSASTNDVDTTSVSYDVRWWSPEKEVPICGHATLAAAGLLFSEASLIPSSVTSLSFRAANGVTLTARKAGDWVEIKLPSTVLQPPTPEVESKISAVLKKALGEDAPVTHLGLGGKGFEYYLMVEVDEAYNLAERKVNYEALRELAPDIIVTVVTSVSSKPDVAFVSRMFAPVAGAPEDHVCGSAHCLLVPHWTSKLGKGGEEMLAKQVSQRGGELKVKWLESEELITLGGKTKTIFKGQLLL